MSNIIRTLIICLMTAFVIPAMAQTSGDKLYSQGLELQKKQTIQSQKSAIAKFQSAKKLYDSAAKKKQCDDAIAVSNNIIRTISSQKNKKDEIPVPNSTELKTSVLELSNEKLQLDYEHRSVTVTITTTESEWSVTPIANSDGEAFVSINRHPEEKKVEIVCSDNKSTRRRSQTIEVRAGELKKTLTIEQSGKPTILSVETTVVEFSSKGGSKSIEVYSNSDTPEKDNNNQNWKVVSKPEWINVIGEEFKEKGALSKLGDKAKGLLKKSSTIVNDSSVVTSVMKLVVSSKSKTDPSRNGEIIISSEDQRATIIVQQK